MTDSESDSSVMELRDRSFDVHVFQSDLSEVDILDEDESEDEVDRALSNLAKPIEAAIARPRSLQRTSVKKSLQPATKKRKVAHGVSTKLVKLKPQQRIENFPDTMLSVSNGQLYCDACHMTLSLKKSIVQDHISSDRHCRGKEARKAQALRQEKVLKSWNLYQKRHADDLSGAGLTHAAESAQSLARIEVVSMFLKAGIPLAKITHLRALLEEGSARLIDESHLRTYIHFIQEMETAKVKAELAHHPPVPVIFYGSTHQEEALAVLVRFVNEEFEIVQRLVRLHVSAKEPECQ